MPPFRFHRPSWLPAALLLAGGLMLAACHDSAPPAPPEIRPVRTLLVEPQQLADATSQTGEIQARFETAQGFRIAGKLIRRPVDVGGVVKAGAVLAELQDQDERNALRSAEADLVAARAAHAEAEAEELRQRKLLADGHTTQARYDAAQRALRTAEARVSGAGAALELARDRLSYTVLKAENDGVVAAALAEAGQVVAAGQPVVRLARIGEKEAVFNIAETLFHTAPHDPVVEVRLISNPAVKTLGRVREVSPSANPVTRTYAVRITLPEAPEAMRLGMAVTGSIRLDPRPVIVLPASALTEINNAPAVWVVEKSADGTAKVNPRAVRVLRYEADRLIVTEGLERGERVVTAGAHKLRPGQPVRLPALEPHS